MPSLRPPSSASTSASYKFYSPPPLTTPKNPFASSAANTASSYTPRTTFSLDRNRTMYTDEIKQDSDDEFHDEGVDQARANGYGVPMSITASSSNLGHSVLTSLVGDHMGARGGAGAPMVIPSMLPPNTLKKALMSRSLESRQERMEEDEEMLAALREQFGLDRWREYAVLRHGNSVKFQTSAHGREMIEAEAIRQNSSDMQVLKEKIKHMSGETKRLRMKLEEERLLKKAAVVKMAQINGEEYIDEDDIGNEENSSVVNQNQIVSPVTFSSLRRTSTGTSGTKLHEKLVINTKSGGYGEASKGATPRSTRRTNLQNFIFRGGGDGRGDVVVGGSVGVGPGIGVGRVVGSDRRLTPSSPPASRAQSSSSRPVASSPPPSPPPSSLPLPPSPSPPSPSTKLSTLKLLRSTRASLQSELKKLQTEISHLNSSMKKEEKIGKLKMMKLRKELERRKNE
ncbi:hypothetical protein TrVE_jg3404 [Triparma verrucosa]|uniref:Uncharacterized protein n=1 Tax=Triparma verrucosa TaxID=1606542 RepID=A0A9W7F4N0_9STRA|nr:hypothetical protein TrVE_jg3404 [Triparma verrucosa]